jgi:hypothetical protein
LHFLQYVVHLQILIVFSAGKKKLFIVANSEKKVREREKKDKEREREKNERKKVRRERESERIEKEEI